MGRAELGDGTQAAAGGQGAGGTLVGAWLPGAAGDRGAHRITFHLVSIKAVSSRTSTWGGAPNSASQVRKSPWRDL